MRTSTRTGGPTARMQAQRPDRGRRFPPLVTWVLLVAAGLGGCSFSPEPVAPPPRPQQPVLERPVEPLVGSYRADRVTGDFAGYASL